MLTLQQIFDKGLAHIRKQGEACVTPNGCFYRKEGRSCIVGGMFPNSVYDPILDTNGGGIDLIVENGGIVLEKMRAALASVEIDLDDKEVQALLRSMQKAHDRVALRTKGEGFLPEFELKMMQVAMEHGLVYTEVGHAVIQA